MKKNCENCKHIEWFEGNPHEGEGESGFICNKRTYDEDYRKERAHQRQLIKDEYRERQKKCCDLIG